MNSPTLDTLKRLSQGFILGNSTIGAHDLIRFGGLLRVSTSTTYGGQMNLRQVVNQLRKERGRARKELERLEAALVALENVGARDFRRVARKVRKSRRKLSAAARRRIGQAQKARWAAIRKSKAAKV
jgi:hypothetical protein